MKNQLKPFILTVLILIADQISKLLVSTGLRVGEKIRVLGDFLWIWHVRNRGMAFSLGSRLPDPIRTVLFIALPLLVISVLVLYYFKGSDITQGQRWCFAVIVGGGLGNQIDRIFRRQGVVDFISFKFYGFLGMERYPTFNVADSTVVVAGIILIITLFFSEQRSRK